MYQTLRAKLTLILILSTCLANAQNCIQNLDSAIYFKYRNVEKAKFYANSLLADLDSSRCVVEIGIPALYNNIGLILWEINEKSRGLYALKKGISKELEIKDSTDRSLLGLYYNLATLYQETSSFSEASKYLLSAEKVVNKSFESDSHEMVKLLLKKGAYYRDIGLFDESLNALNQALQIKDYQEIDSTTVSIKIELGTTYRHFGDLERSEIELLDAMKLAKEIDEFQYLIAIDRLSSLKMEQGEYSDSENYLLYNLKQKEEKYTEDPILALETLNGLGILYYRLNDLKSASEYINKALTLSSDLRGVRPYLINNLGTLYMKEGELDKALTCFNEGTEGFKQLFGTLNPDYASGLSNIASVYKQQGQLSKALNLYTHVLDIDKVVFGTNHQRYATSLNNVGLAYMELGNLSLAGKLLTQSSQIRKDLLGVYHPIYIKNLNDLGIYHLLQKDSIQAMNLFNEALKLEIKHMQDIFPVLTDKQRELYFREARFNIERFNSLAFSDSYIQSEFAEDAFNHFINTKGILFYASEKMRRIIQNTNDNGVKKLYENWREKKYHLAQAYLLTEEERNHRKISISELEGACNEIEKALAQKLSIFSEENQSSYHTWQEVSDLLDDETATVDIISYRNYIASQQDSVLSQGFENRNNYIAMIIRSDSTLKPVRLSKSIDFEKNFSKYRNALRYGVTDKSSYTTFWKPIDEQLGNCNKIKFAPDGIYHKMNPSVYFDAERSQFVMDLYDVINVTSAKDLIYSETNDLIYEAKIFGNPDFSSLSGLNLTQLPGAEREASAITEILDVRRWRTETFYFKEATERQVKSLTNPGILHLATHGYFEDDPDNTNPLNSSGIFLSKSDTGNEDGRLTAYEAMNLTLDETNAVVLAACETGLGSVQNGEGVFGLQRALLVAGSENVILSLVKINDEAAMKFMQLFYQNLIEVKEPQQAFFNARRTFKSQDTNPYNWGAYVLVSR